MVAQSFPINEIADRSYDRHNLLVSVKLRRPGESWFNARLANLSPTGFRVQSFTRLDLDATIYVMLPGFDGRKAKVVWVREHEAGCQFERPLHPAIFDHVVRMSRLREREGQG